MTAPHPDWAKLAGLLDRIEARHQALADVPAITAAMDQSAMGWRDEFTQAGLDLADEATVYTALNVLLITSGFAQRWGLRCEGMALVITSLLSAWATFVPEEVRRG